MSQELASMYRASVNRAEEAIFGEGTFEGQRFVNAHAKKCEMDTRVYRGQLQIACTRQSDSYVSSNQHTWWSWVF